METKDKINVNLQWAQWEEWFQKYHEFREQYLEHSGDALFNDVKSVSPAMKYFYKYVNAVSIQTTILNDELDIDKELDTIIKLYSEKKYDKCISESRKLYKKIELKLMELKITPKPEEEEKDEVLTEKDDKIRASLEAFNIIYGKNEASDY